MLFASFELISAAVLDVRGIPVSPTKRRVIEFDVGCKLTSCHKTTAPRSSGNRVEFNWQLFFAPDLLDYGRFLSSRTFRSPRTPQKFEQHANELIFHKQYAELSPGRKLNCNVECA